MGLAIRASSWVVLGYGFGQACRLGSNLILTRLLAPEYFGLMALVQIFSQGVKMFSDVGFRGNIVSSPRGDDPVFLNTAWSIQVIRGALLWLVVCAIAGPGAAFYGEPELRILVPVVGVGILISGFQSTATFTLVRNVSQGRRVAFELFCQLAGIALMITWAWISPTIWALVAGNLLTSALSALLSHFLIRGYRNRFQFERQSIRSIVGFGKWILLSTALTFLLSQGDRILLGKLIGVSDLGIYTIAAMLAATIVSVTAALAANVLFPIFARIERDNSAELHAAAMRMRLLIFALGLPPLWVLVLYGPEIVSFLYDDRYAAAGWMAQIIAFGAVASVLMVTAERLLMVKGSSYHFMLSQLVQAFLALSGIGIGGFLAGLQGVLVGLAAGRWLAYPVVAFMLWRRSLWMPGIDLPAILLSGSVLALGFTLL